MKVNIFEFLHHQKQEAGLIQFSNGIWILYRKGAGEKEALRVKFTTLKEVVQKLTHSYKPDRIILYGSTAKAGVRKGRDIDLLIIKRTSKGFIDRIIEVETLLSPRTIPLDLLVYTPTEIRRLFSMGSPFIEEILEKGKVLYMRKETENCLKDAQEELEAAAILYEHAKYRASCYHAQQSVEKGLKALILEKGKVPQRTHDLVELLEKVNKLGWSINLDMDEIIFLNSVYRGRCPNEQGLLPHGEPSQSEAKKGIEAAEKFQKNIHPLIQ